MPSVTFKLESMNIKSIIIKNFRSIGSDGVNISFDSNITALIGKNNVGKSNILAAIDYILGGYWAYEKDFTLEDFYQKNINNDIEICVFFNEPLEYRTTIEGWYEHKVKVYGFKLEYKTYKRDTEDAKVGELHLEYTCVNAKGDIIRIPTIAPRRSRPAAEFKASFTQILHVTRDLRAQVRVVYIPVERDILKYSPSNSRSLLGGLLKTIKERFISDKEEIVISEALAEILGTATTLTRDELFNIFIEKANDTLKTEDVKILSETLSHFLSEHIGDKEAESIDLNFAIQDTWAQYKNLELTIQNNGVLLPAHRVGQGLQSLIVIAIFRTYLKLKDIDAIFLIEEPEMFLHTHAKKYFYSVLESLAKSGVQIIFSTHATEFVSILNYKNVKRVINYKNSSRVLPEDAVELDFNNDELLKLDTAINNERAELFFAEKVILVEGETEKIVYDFLIRLKGLDPNLLNISIIETSGKGSMYRYIQLLESLRIPFVVIADTDILEFTGDSERDLKIKENNDDALRKNRRIEESINDKSRLFMNHPYFEVVAGISKNNIKKVESKPLTAIKYFQDIGSYQDIMGRIPKVLYPIEFLLSDA